jgi:hypothetical protein
MYVLFIHTCNPSTLEARVGDYKFGASLTYTVRSYLKKNKTKAGNQGLTPSNPSYSAGRDQENSRLKPWAHSLGDPILKIPNTKKGW